MYHSCEIFMECKVIKSHEGGKNVTALNDGHRCIRPEINRPENTAIHAMVMEAIFKCSTETVDMKCRSSPAKMITWRGLAFPSNAPISKHSGFFAADVMRLIRWSPEEATNSKIFTFHFFGISGQKQEKHQSFFKKIRSGPKDQSQICKSEMIANGLIV